MEQLAIRQLKPEDATAAAELCAQLGYARSAADILRWIESRRSVGDQAAMVATGDGEVLGWIEVYVEHRLQAEPYALIGGLVVREGARGRRIGQRLCLAAEQWARGRGVQLMRVTSRSTRQDAHRFYLRDGYEIVKTSVVFEKTLRP